jgi:hypothetical protein
MTIAECQRRVSEAVSQIDVQKAVIVQSMEVDMVEMEQKRMFEGLLSTGEPTTPYYTPFTVAIKTAKGQPTDRVTLKDTGDFYNAMFVEVIGDSVVFDSKDYKSEDLKDKYGETIFGLSDENRTEVKSMFAQRLLQWFRELTKL